MPKTKRKSKRIDTRHAEQHKLLVEQLRKIPIVQLACERVGISRATFYRWMNDDEAFATEVEEANREGTAFINDMAESQLIGAIKNQNFAAISFWLRNRHKAYADKLRVDTTLTQKKPQQMSEEESHLVADVLLQLSERRTSILNQAHPAAYGNSPPIEPSLDGRDDHPDADEPRGADANRKGLA